MIFPFKAPLLGDFPATDCRGCLPAHQRADSRGCDVGGLWFTRLPSGNLLHSYWKSPCFMGKSTKSIAIFNSYVGLPEGQGWILCQICFVSYPKCLIFILWTARRELKPQFRPLAATACVPAMVSTILVTMPLLSCWHLCFELFL